MGPLYGGFPLNSILITFYLPPVSPASFLPRINPFFILVHVPRIFYYFVQWPINAQLFHKLSHSYMFRHYSVKLIDLPEDDTTVSKHVGGVW
jgi:hypothetical protein